MVEISVTYPQTLDNDIIWSKIWASKWDALVYRGWETENLSISKVPVIFWSYLHLLGFTHRDLFAILAQSSIIEFIETYIWSVPTSPSLETLKNDKFWEFTARILQAIFQKISLTDERKSKIHSAFLEQPFTSYQTKIQKSDIQIFLYSDERFPMELLTIPNTPFLIYVRGDLATTGTKIGMVGSRDATPYGEQVVTSFVPKLVQAGISIVSGGALGIDGLAHESTLKSKWHTIVVLGSGIDKPYPKAHENLFEKVIESWWAVISHFPIGTTAAPYTFPQRNEIIAGLCRGLIVVEAKEQSGSLITAQLALEMGKDVFAIPSDISRRNSLGANRLIQNASAKLLLSPDDILDEYGLLSQKPVENPQLHDISKNSLEYHILTALDGNSFTVDALVEMLGSNTNEIQIGLWKMEIQGTITRNISGQYSIYHG